MFPALALLFRLALRGRFAAAEITPAEVGRQALRAGGSRLLARSATGCLIAGFGLLSVADAGWAHAVGVACLFGFVVLAFRAIVVPAIAADTAKRNDRGFGYRLARIEGLALAGRWNGCWRQ